MKTNLRNVLTLLFASLALNASTCSAPKPVIVPVPVTPKHSLVVSVRDEDGIGINGAVVSVVDESPNPDAGQAATTNQNGDVTGWFLTQAGFTICTEPSGYQKACQGVTLTSDQTIILVPKHLSQPVHLDGTHLRKTDGSIYHVRRITALDLENTDLTTFLDYAKSAGLNEVRVLTEAKITTDLSPVHGEAGIEPLCNALRVRGMGAELVANADTATLGQSDLAIETHTKLVTEAIVAHCADLPIELEICNECANTGSGGQSYSLQNPDFINKLYQDVKSIAPELPVALGSPCCNQPDTVPIFSGGDYITEHLDRGRSPFWDEVRRIKDLIDEVPTYHRLVADDEPMGAGEVEIAGRRSTNPVRFFTQGVLDRLGELESTVHCEDCVSAKVPGPTQQACITSYVSGANLVPEDQIYEFYNDSNANSATAGANWTHVQKLFTFINVTGGDSLLVALNVTGDLGIKWTNGWHQIGELDTSVYPGISILKIGR